MSEELKGLVVLAVTMLFIAGYRQERKESLLAQLESDRHEESSVPLPVTGNL